MVTHLRKVSNGCQASFSDGLAAPIDSCAARWRWGGTGNTTVSMSRIRRLLSLSSLFIRLMLVDIWLLLSLSLVLIPSSPPPLPLILPLLLPLLPIAVKEIDDVLATVTSPLGMPSRLWLSLREVGVGGTIAAPGSLMTKQIQQRLEKQTSMPSKRVKPKP